MNYVGNMEVEDLSCMLRFAGGVMNASYVNDSLLYHLAQGLMDLILQF